MGDVLPLVLTLGDPAGVGPELIAAAWARRVEDGLAPFFAMGGAELIAAAFVLVIGLALMAGMWGSVGGA